ncbi:odorant receptor 42b-like [Drosophila nasuta]|uniref:odorant receptor 42b-like n=1 Tax=Drosophila nasuta TaxID=42062 RepID=UPI00295F4116|nr:odorant receptor 42b-like [Drosophila nasuta]
MDKSCTKNAEKLQIHRSVVLCNSIFFIIFVIYNMYSVSTLSTALINGVAPWNVYNPILNWRDGTWELLLSSLIEFILVYFPAVYNNAADIYPVIYGLTIRLHINLLIKRIELLRCDDNRSEEEHYEELTGCIKDHKRLLEYCNILRPLISRIIFVQFIMVGIIFGLCMTNLFFFADMWTCISTMSYIFGCIFQTFPFCYICNMMEDAVSDLTLSIFQSNWLGAPRRYKSSLLYFMHQSQQPIKFTAGSIFEISLATNINLAKFAFTVVTIVQQFNLAEKLDRK